MNDHIWLASSATVLFILASVVWLACSTYWSESLYFPTMIVVLLALGLISAAAWHSGETVYVHGTAVEAATSAQPSLSQPDTQASEPLEPTDTPQTSTHGGRRDEYSVNRPEQGLIEPFIPPLQLHV